MAKLEAGATAPAFTLPDQDGKPVKLSDFKGQRVIVYFYPADDTPGCTKEACQFNDNLKTFEKAGVAVLGISPDKAEKHVKFRTKYKLKFPLLTDADKKVMEKYGAWGEKTMYGKKTVGTIRSTFLVGPNGKIQRAWYHVRADGHAAKVLEEIAEELRKPVKTWPNSPLRPAWPSRAGLLYQVGVGLGFLATTGPTARRGSTPCARCARGRALRLHHPLAQAARPPRDGRYALHSFPARTTRTRSRARKGAPRDGPWATVRAQRRLRDGADAARGAGTIGGGRAVRVPGASRAS